MKSNKIKNLVFLRVPSIVLAELQLIVLNIEITSNIFIQSNAFNSSHSQADQVLSFIHYSTYQKRYNNQKQLSVGENSQHEQSFQSSKQMQNKYPLKMHDQLLTNSKPSYKFGVVNILDIHLNTSWALSMIFQLAYIFLHDSFHTINIE